MTFIKKKLALITIVYWFLLLYIVAALIWWFVALSKQANEMAKMRLDQLTANDSAYMEKKQKIADDLRRKDAQFIGEGTIFLALILVGAVFVYRATRRQLRLSQQQQNFMMAVTHELKTPIAIAQLNLETLQKRKLDEETQHKLIHNTLNEANRLNTLCNNILLAAQLDGGEYSTNIQEINLSDLVEGCIENCISRFPSRKMESSIQEGIYINGEQLLLQMLLNNLIENALKYAPKDKPIIVTLNEVNNNIQLKVADYGFGISDAEKKKIFEKFYRSGNEKTRTTKGTGLGLYLCSKIAAQHNGYISVTDNQPSGSIFAVIFKH